VIFRLDREPESCKICLLKNKKQEAVLSMKSITEVLGSVQQVFEFDFDYRHVFDEEPTEDHVLLLRVFQILRPENFIRETLSGGRGRPRKSRKAIYSGFIAARVLGLETISDTRKRLLSDPNLRKICGYPTRKAVPSCSVFSRAFKSFVDDGINKKVHDIQIKEFVSDVLVGHICRDSTAIKAREKAVKTKITSKLKGSKKKRGRPKKGTIPQPRDLTVIESQIDMSSEDAIRSINRKCCWGSKQNSQGNKEYWAGYKLHLDVTDFGLPVTALLTGANVYDNQVAIPMEKITSGKIEYLYSVMDAAYDSKPIREYILSQSRVPVIDYNKRRGCKIEMEPARKARLKVRSVVERSNAHLKDWLIGRSIHFKGPDKVFEHLMFGINVLTAVKILQYILPYRERLAA